MMLDVAGVSWFCSVFRTQRKAEFAGMLPQRWRVTQITLEIRKTMRLAIQNQPGGIHRKPVDSLRLAGTFEQGEAAHENDASSFIS